MSNPNESRDGLSTHDELRRIADELEIEVHLAAMRPSDRWRLLGPRVLALEAQLEHAERVVPEELALLLSWIIGENAALN